MRNEPLDRWPISLADLEQCFGYIFRLKDFSGRKRDLPCSARLISFPLSLSAYLLPAASCGDNHQGSNTALFIHSLLPSLLSRSPSLSLLIMLANLLQNCTFAWLQGVGYRPGPQLPACLLPAQLPFPASPLASSMPSPFTNVDPRSSIKCRRCAAIWQFPPPLSLSPSLSCFAFFIHCGIPILAL